MENRIRTPFRNVTIACVIMCALAFCAATSAGTFKDRDGAAHAWSIDEAHALIWEGAAYVPFGIVFEPRYLALEQTEENWVADEQEVQALKLAGIADVTVKAGDGITSVPAEAFQRIIDLLETSGLRYGIALYDPPYAPLSGYVIEPTLNRVDGVQTSGEITRGFANAKTALYALCDARTAAVKDVGREVVVNGEVTVRVSLRDDTDHVLLFYPQKALPDAGLFDIWSDYDRHRDRLVSYLSRIKFGKGLRFFIDPFTENLGVKGEADSLIPTSAAFRLEYAAWLTKKYGSPRDLNAAWRVLQHDVTSFDEAVRLIPLWRSGRGAPMVYDDGAAKKYPVDATGSNIWMDFLEFRAYSVRAYMDAAADALKRLAADVPVVYTASELQPIFQSSSRVGFDGLAVPPSGSDEASAAGAGRVFSLAEGSSRRTWIVARLDPGGAAYEKKEDLFASINAIRDLGAKGFFVQDPRGTGVSAADLLVWLAEYSSLSASDRQFAGYRPHAVYYPEGVAHAKVKRLSSGAWWLPALVAGSNLYLGSGLAGYTAVNPKGGVDLYVWSQGGPRTIHAVASDTVTLVGASGDTTEVNPKKGRVELTIGQDPVLVRGIPADRFLPVELVAEAIQEFEKAIGRAEQKRLDTGTYKHDLRTAKDLLDKNQLGICLEMVRSITEEINQRLRGLETVGDLTRSAVSGT